MKTAEKPPSRVLIIGKTRMGRAVAHYLKGRSHIGRVTLTDGTADPRPFDILIGALAGDIGKQSLALALKHKKHLIDLADIEPEFYLSRQDRIAAAGITVIPCCGFSPGLLDFILGREMKGRKNVSEIAVAAGTLAEAPDFFPFLWCFEDLYWGHTHGSRQKIAGRFKNFPPFGGYRREVLAGIKAETYYCQSGFDNLLDVYPARDFTFRVIRPPGFAHFFRFLENHGFFRKTRREETRTVLEGEKRDNLTLAEIVIVDQGRRLCWRIKSRAGKTDRLNSMQRVTAPVPALMAEVLAAGGLADRGLTLMPDLGRNERLFQDMIRNLRRTAGLTITRREGPLKETGPTRPDTNRKPIFPKIGGF